VADQPLHSVSVAGVVVDDAGRVLVIQRRDNGQWEPPGGVLELDETPEAGVRREVFEETGLQVEVERLTGVYKNMPRGIVALVFRCRPVAGLLMPSTETRAVEWVHPDAVRSRMAEAYAVRVHDALRAATTVAVRAHDGQSLLASDPGS